LTNNPFTPELAPAHPPQPPDFQAATPITTVVCGGLADMKPVKAGL
jgi:hypothetical protein